MRAKTITLSLIMLMAAACTVTPTPIGKKNVQPLPSKRTVPAIVMISPSIWTPTTTRVPTRRPTITLSPSITPSPTKVISPTPHSTRSEVPLEISLASTLIRLSDLPPGFEQIDSDDQELQYIPLEDEGISAMESVTYSNEQTKCSIISASFKFADQESQLRFDDSIDHIEETIQQRFDEMGLAELGLKIEVELVPSFPQIGNKSVAIRLTVVFILIKKPMEIALFRHDGYGGIVIILPSSTKLESLDLRDLAILQHDRIVAVFDGGS